MRVAGDAGSGTGSLPRLFGEGAPTPRRSRRGRIVCGVERLPLAKQRVAVHALGQALDVGGRDAASREVLAPPVNHLDDVHDFGGGLRLCVAKEFALRHGVGQRRIPLGSSDDELLVPLA